MLIKNLFLFIIITIDVRMTTLCFGEQLNNAKCINHDKNEPICANHISIQNVPMSKLVNILNQQNVSNIVSLNELEILNFRDISTITKFTTNVLGPIQFKLEQTFVQLLTSLNLSQECQLSIFKIIDSIKHGELWPMSCKLIKLKKAMVIGKPLL